MIKQVLIIGWLTLMDYSLIAQPITYNVDPVISRLRLPDMDNNRVVFDGERYTLPLYADRAARVRTLLKYQGSLYATLDGSGHVLQFQESDSTVNRWKRMDSIPNTEFYHKHQAFGFRQRIHMFGGKGLGHVNGDFRRLEKQGNWNILPVNDNFPFFGELFIDDPSRNKVWMICPPHIVENTNSVLDSYVVGSIELETGKIHRLGKIDKSSDIKPTRPLFMSLTLGGMVIADQGKVWLLNINENKAFELVDRTISKWLLNTDPSDPIPIWEHNGMIYRFHAAAGKIDSLTINVGSFEKKGQRFYKRPDSGYIWSVVVMALLIAVIIGYSRLRRKVKTQIKPTLTSTPLSINEIGQEIASNRHKPGPLNPIDLLLIQGIIEKMEQQEKFTVSDMNRLLGVSRKSEIIQKKTRREAIIRINTAFKQILVENSDLIIHSRSSEDKRYFHYHISKNNLEVVKRVLG